MNYNSLNSHKQLVEESMMDKSMALPPRKIQADLSPDMDLPDIHLVKKKKKKKKGKKSLQNELEDLSNQLSHLESIN